MFHTRGYVLMKVIEKNIGPKIGYDVMGNKIMFADELMLNLEKMERDFEVHIDICKDKFGMLTMGLSENYVAEIEIPARKYVEEQGEADEQGNTVVSKVPVPFNMDEVTLILWSMEG